MFVYPHDETRSLLVLHADHSRLVGQLAAWWSGVHPYLPVVLAAYEHDASWRAWDMRPYLDPDGQPIDGRTPYMAPYLLDLGARAVNDVLERDAYAALVVSLHWESVLGAQPPPEAEAFLAEQAALRASVAEMLLEDGRFPRETSESALRVNADLLSALNTLAEWLPHRDGTLEVGDLTARDENGQVVLTPYPFTKQPLEVSLPARVVRRRFASHEAFLEEFFRADEIRLRLCLR